MRLANNYGQVLELEKAIQYYEKLYALTRGRGIADPNAPDAIFNAGMMRVGIGDYKGAALNYERYAKDNPEQEDAANIYFLAGEQWERVGEQDALRFYRRYINDYPDAVPDAVMESLHKIALLTEKTGKEREADAAWADVAAGFRRLAGGGKLGVSGRKAAAQGAYRALARDYDAFIAIKYTADDAKNAELMRGKFEELKALETKGTELASIQDFEYGSGGLVLVGKAYIALGDMLFNAPLPRGLSEEDQMFIREEIDKQRIPIEDKGKARLQTVVQVGLDQKQWSRFQDEAQAYLAERFPAEFAPVRAEVRASGAASDVRIGGPISLEDPKPKPAPESAGGGDK
jgi:tetratricopeptide (TPR) repeat protein